MRRAAWGCPMSSAFALLGAVLYGIADFAGGVGARRISPFRVTAWSQLLGLPLLFVGLVAIGWEAVGTADLAYGAAAGAFGFVGIVALYGALAAGTMSIVSPLTGALTALIPVVWGLATGEAVSPVQWGGIALALTAISLVAWDHAHAKLTVSVAVRAFVASLGFAGFFVMLSYTAEEAGQWPLVAGRSVSLFLGFGVLVVLRELAFPERGALPPVLVAGNGDVAANIAVLIALQTGPLGISVVLTSIYPAFTALAAVVYLHERPTVVQRIGIILALVAAVLLIL